MIKSFILKGAALLVISAFGGVLFATGTVWSEVKDNVAYVYHDDARFNCCPEMVITQDIDEDIKVIDIFEQDTQPACDCMCFYDFTHEFEGLAPGEYTANVWEADCKECEFTLAGTTNFVIVSKISPLAVFDTMSSCHEEPGVRETPERETVDLQRRSLYPVEIAFTLSEISSVNLSIFDVSGRKVRTLFVGQMERGEHILKWDMRDNRGEYLPKGIYIATLATSRSAKSLPLIVLK